MLASFASGEECGEMITEIVGVISGVTSAGLVVALIKSIGNTSREQKDNDELSDSNQTLIRENMQLKLELSQISANRDNLLTATHTLEAQAEREKVARELAEGQRDELLAQLEKIDPSGTGIAAAIKLELERLRKLKQKGVPPTTR